MRITAAAILLLMSQCAFADQLPVLTETAACEAVKARGTIVFHLGHRAHPFCEILKDAEPEFFIIGLHAGLPCPGHQDGCVGLIGWYAVGKGTSRVIRWDVANDRPGEPL